MMRRLSSVSSITRMRFGIFFPSLRDFRRNADAEARAGAKRRLDRDRSAMHLDDAPADREPEARAALLPCVGVVDLLELLENALLVGIGDAGAGVAHRQLEIAADQL